MKRSSNVPYGTHAQRHHSCGPDLSVQSLRTAGMRGKTDVPLQPMYRLGLAHRICLAIVMRLKK